LKLFFDSSQETVGNNSCVNGKGYYDKILIFMVKNIEKFPLSVKEKGLKIFCNDRQWDLISPSFRLCGPETGHTRLLDPVARFERVKSYKLKAER
jgi:hypothetical protein